MQRRFSAVLFFLFHLAQYKLSQCRVPKNDGKINCLPPSRRGPSTLDIFKKLKLSPWAPSTNPGSTSKRSEPWITLLKCLWVKWNRACWRICIQTMWNGYQCIELRIWIMAWEIGWLITRGEGSGSLIMSVAFPSWIWCWKRRIFQWSDWLSPGPWSWLED